jgi:hypothetical protein
LPNLRQKVSLKKWLIKLLILKSGLIFFKEN